MKSSKIWVVLLLVTVLLMSIGSVGAYMRKQTEIVQNVFAPAEVSCAVNETFQNNKKTNITIKNTGNIEAYLRLRLVTYWVDGNGNILFESSPTISMDDVVSNCWIKSGDTYYYEKPVQSGESTDNLLKSGESIELGVDSNGNHQVIEVFAEAIQSKPTEAVTSAWSVILDSNGNIIALQ